MTAYGRSGCNTKAGHFFVEIQTINRKFLDVQVVLPRELGHFDIEVKKWIANTISRGQVSIKAGVVFEGTSPYRIIPNLPLARQLKEAWQQIAIDLSIDIKEVDLSFLKEKEGLFIYEEDHTHDDLYREGLKQAFTGALDHLLKMKAMEGAHLQEDILQRLEIMRSLLKEIENKVPLAPNRYREKLMGRLQELLPGVENEERILREIALFAEKIDIAEEITRFYCHLIHFEEIMHGENFASGKTLEFIIQEMNREINTIGSKSLDLNITRCVVGIKSELERIREQIQNVE